MKKTFLKVSLIGLLAVSMPFSFTSCKDYDDDISSLNQKTDGLSSQLTALQSALSDAQAASAAAAKAAEDAAAAAKAAQATGDAAAKAAAEAKQEAEAAAKAAADAKAEAIEAAVAQVQQLLKGYASADELSKLAGTIEGIQKGLSTLEDDLKALDADVDENTRAITAINTQISALQKFEEATGKDLTSIKSELADLKSQLDSKMSKDDVDALLRTAKEDITKQINSAVADAISTLKDVLSNRLTSVTLVPDLYIDGIETIEFVSLKYTPKKQGATGLVSAGSDVIVSSEENPAHYRLNPITTGLDDIDADNIEFVAYTATSRGAVASPISYVKGSAEIEKTGVGKGIMTVRAKKNVTTSLNLSNGQIYTVALKVPIASNLCDDPSVPEYVYSEYSRLSENTLTPEIAELDGKYSCTKTAHKHYSDSITIWGANVASSELVTKKVLYNTTLDLLPLVTGCKKEDAAEITKEDLAKYGLEFRFAIPTAPYTTGAENGTDQQKFIAINGSVVSSKLPNGSTNNKAAVDKQPIIRVTLYDKVNNNIVDQRYLKIKWVDEEVKPVDLGTKEFVTTLGCENTKVQLTWEDFINIYGEVKGEKFDMSKDQFSKVYLSTAPTIKVNYDVLDGPGMYSDPDVSADAAVLYWEMTPAEIGTIVKYNTGVTPHTWELTNNVFTGTITFTPNNNDYPVLTLTLKQTIKVGTTPSINGFYGNYWTTPYSVYSVYPVQYGTPANKELANTTCEFHNNLMNAFTFSSNGFIVKDLSSCGTWDMQFCKDNNLAGYAPNYEGGEPDLDTANNIGGYNLMKGTNEAAQLVWDEGHTAWCGNSEHNEAYIDLRKNGVGKALLNNKTHIGVWATINAFNMIPVYDFDVKFVEPLNIQTAVIEDSFDDGVVSGSRIDWTKCFKMYDCFGYTVAKVTTDFVTEKAKYAADLYAYYEVSEPEWNTEGIKFGMKVVNGNVVVDENSKMSKAELSKLTTGGSIPSLVVDGDELVFYSNMGSQVAEPFFIWIPVTVEYGWGSVTTEVKVKVNPMDNNPLN